MKKVINFLEKLSRHNDRAWFNEHKAEYLSVKERFDGFVGQLIEGIRSFDDSIGPLAISDCTYRIYRDTRFSSDKSPYKTHMGAFICPKGKKSGYAGYYFQVGPQESGYDAGCMLATGNYYCQPVILKMLREDIEMDEGREFKEALDTASGFELDWTDALKRVPKCQDPEAPYSQWLRLRNFCLVREPGLDYMTAPDLLDRLIADFRSTQPFLSFINRAIDFHNSPEN